MAPCPARKNRAFRWDADKREMDMKSLFNIPTVPLSIQGPAVVGSAADRQSAGIGKAAESLIILLFRSEGGGELFRLEVFMMERAGRIIKLLEKVGQASRLRSGSPMARRNGCAAGSRPVGANPRPRLAAHAP